MFNKCRKAKSLFSTTQVITLGFAFIILLGAILLMLPISSNDGTGLSFIDALFTATSACCVTGLVVVDTAVHFNIFGQIVIMLLIQIGGLGVIAVATLGFLIIGKKITLKERMLIQTALNQDTMSGVVLMMKKVLIFTVTIEGAGALMLMPTMAQHYGYIGLFKAIFISVSAFCNAGFDLMGTVDNQFISLTGFSNNIVVVLTVSFLIIIGGIGFTVISNITSGCKWRKLTLNTKTVLTTTACLLILGTLLLFVLEINDLISGEVTFYEHLLNSWFNAVTPRTAGFSTVDVGSLTQSSRIVTIVLMIIGASPCSTGGGIKTTTFAILIFIVFSCFRNSDKIVISGKAIPTRQAYKAIFLLFAWVILIFGMTMIISAVEGADMDSGDILFEVVSALGTVGLSTGITPALATTSKYLLALCMFIGRLGPITIIIFFATQKHGLESVNYPVGNIMVG